MKNMIVSMTLELKDIPGQLIMALSPISELHGNMISIIHQHEEKTPRGTISVEVMFDIKQENLDELINRLENNGIRVVRLGEERLRASVSVILIGHIIHSDIKDTIDKIDSTGYAEVVELSISMPGIDVSSSAYIVINAINEKRLNDALKILMDVSEKKDFLMIDPIKLNLEKV